MKTGRVKRQTGFSVLELLAGIAMVGTLITVALPAYDGYEERMQLVEVQKDFGIIEMRIQRYFVSYGEYPPSLEVVGMDKDDPWGNPYRYMNMSSKTGNGKVRKKHGNVPVNNDFDLYSAGPDGDSRSPMNSVHSRDDIVRADGGDFVGWATEYCAKDGVKC